MGLSLDGTYFQEDESLIGLIHFIFLCSDPGEYDTL